MCNLLQTRVSKRDTKNMSCLVSEWTTQCEVCGILPVQQINKTFKLVYDIYKNKYGNNLFHGLLTSCLLAFILIEY